MFDLCIYRVNNVFSDTVINNLLADKDVVRFIYGQSIQEISKTIKIIGHDVKTKYGEQCTLLDYFYRVKKFRNEE